MTPADEHDPSELAASDESGEDGVIVAAPRTHHAAKPEGAGGGADAMRKVALKAVGAAEEAMDAVIEVMRKPNRGSLSQLNAALKVLEMAQRYQADVAPDADGKTYVLDRAEAGRVLAKRLGLQE